MSDQRAAYDEGQLPWLQAVEDEDQPRGLSARKMLAALTVAVLAIGILAAAFFVLGRAQGPSSGAPELIRAPEAPYKIRPSDPGGLDVAGESETAFKTSAGEDPDSALDLSKLPETPVEKARPAPAAPPPPVAETGKVEAAKPATKAEPKPVPQPSGAKGTVIQLGAFANRAQAERAWESLSGRFPVVGGLSKMIVPFSGGIRLRASAASPQEATRACNALKAAGENCFVAG